MMMVNVCNPSPQGIPDHLVSQKKEATHEPWSAAFIENYNRE
jgi:hypothetical protein